MIDPPSPPAVNHPPPSPPRSNLPMLYYGLVVVGTAAIVLVLYNLVIVKWCTEFTDYRPRRRASRRHGTTPTWRIHNSMFEEGEEVKKLPKCKHSFHAPCIDMWLYSHLDCPLCRSPVEPPLLHRHAVTEQPPTILQQHSITEPSEHSREVLLGPGLFV